jgi:RHS repeat-associated protein
MVCLAHKKSDTPAAASEERGYTGHEHLDNVSLIHMNGRLLDPKLGRVISADPIVASPLFSQSYNRYLYVNGNPLKYTDPSGFAPKDVPPPGGSPICTGLCWLPPCFMDPFCALPSDIENEFFDGSRDDLMYLAIAQPLYDALIAQLANLPHERNFPAAKTDQGGQKPTVPTAFVGPVYTLDDVLNASRSRQREYAESLAQTQEMFARHDAERAALEEAGSLRNSLAGTLEAAGNAMIVADIALAGPTGEGIVPGTALKSLAGRVAARSAPKSWTAARNTYWKQFGPGGKAPTREVLVRDTRTGQVYRRTETKELHHIDPQRAGGRHDPSNLREAWPTEHAALDPHRHPGYEVIRILSE